MKRIDDTNTLKYFVYSDLGISKEILKQDQFTFFEKGFVMALEEINDYLKREEKLNKFPSELKEILKEIKGEQNE